MKGKKKRAKKKLPNKRKKRGRPKKVIRRIGVFIPLQANIEAQKIKLDEYIVKQGCQRLSIFYENVKAEKGTIELYARTRYVGRTKAKIVKPITIDSLATELTQITKQAKAKLFP